MTQMIPGNPEFKDFDVTLRLSTLLGAIDGCRHAIPNGPLTLDQVWQVTKLDTHNRAVLRVKTAVCKALLTEDNNGTN
jgi:hypothetical protein